MVHLTAPVRSISCVSRGCFDHGDSFRIRECRPNLLNYECQHQQRKANMRGCQTARGVPETATAILVTVLAVGTGAAFVLGNRKASEFTESPSKPCEACGGSGLCAECNGEGYVLKRLGEATAEQARLNAKNMATRYTAGLPKKWSYCSKCSSARYCRVCDGRGQVKG
ncbi:uncharacterized protein LOC116266135 [Nymphaea colorata]|nr:uncharacterized protein LOC116266135 [Nymphaea colorata]